MAKLYIGDPAPDFTLHGTDGTFTLSEHKGERVVLLFYPGDDTSVCTKQMCSDRDRADDVAALPATLSLTFDSVDDIAAALQKLPAAA